MTRGTRVTIRMKMRMMIAKRTLISQLPTNIYDADEARAVCNARGR